MRAVPSGWNGCELSIRLATVDDAGAIAAVKVAGWRDTYTGLMPPALLEVALDERRVALRTALELAREPNFCVAGIGQAGCVGFALFLVAGRPEPHLESFHVLAGARGRGIGARLLTRSVSELQALGFATCTVSVLERNLRSVALYERLGAVWTGTTLVGSPADQVRERDYRWPDLATLRSVLESAPAAADPPTAQ
jgi:ribosomal protein S18 acetylase RimI-like enzyme